MIMELLRRDRLVLVVAIALALLGLRSWFSMPRQEDAGTPDRIGLLLVPYPGADPLNVERLMVEPIEDALVDIEEIAHVSVDVRSGFAIFRIWLRHEVHETQPIWDEVEAALTRVRRTSLPEGVGPFDLRHHGTSTESVVLAIIGSRDRLALFEKARMLRSRLLADSLVARVELHGDPHEELSIALDETSLRAHGLARSEIVRWVRARSTTQAAGTLEVGSQSVDLTPQVDFQTVEELRRTPIPISAESSIPLGAIATVRRQAADPPSEFVRYQGETAVVVGVVPREGIDVVHFGERVRDIVHHTELGPDFEIHELAYQPELVESRLANLSLSLLQALAVVAGLLILTMGFRLGGVVGAVVPLVALATVGVYSLGGGILHQISVVGLVMSIGLLVDNAIVVAEDIQRRLDEGESSINASSGAVRSLAWPLFSSTGTTLAAFAPMYVAVGPAADFTRAIPIMVGIALTLSYVFAVTVTPVMARLFLRRNVHKTGSRAVPIARWIGRLSSRRPEVAMICVAGLVAVGAATRSRVARNFFPESDRSQAVVELSMPSGTSLEATDEVVRRLEDWISRQPECASIAVFIGLPTPQFYYNLAGMSRRPSVAQLMVTTPSVPSVLALIERLRRQAPVVAPEARVVARRLQQGPPVLAPMEIRLFAEDLDRLDRLTREVEIRLSEVPGTRDVRSTLGSGNPALRAWIDDAGAVRHGVARADVATALYGRTRGLPIAVYRAAEEPIPIVLRSGVGVASPDEIEALGIDAAGHEPVPFAEVARLDLVHIPTIQRRDRRRMSAVYAELEGRATVESVSAVLTPALQSMELGERDWEYGGALESSVEARDALAAQAPLGFLLLVVFLLLEFNSLRRVLIILSTAPLAVMGVWPGLWLADQPFGFLALLGIIALIGIVVNNAIVLVDFADHHRQSGASVEESLARAVQVRLRPILLTTATTVLGLVPLLNGATTLSPPIAAAMISGLLLATLLTLFAVPALYRLLIRGGPRRFPAVASWEGDALRSSVVFLALSAGVLSTAARAEAQELAGRGARESAVTPSETAESETAESATSLERGDGQSLAVETEGRVSEAPDSEDAVSEATESLAPLDAPVPDECAAVQRSRDADRLALPGRRLERLVEQAHSNAPMLEAARQAQNASAMRERGWMVGMYPTFDIRARYMRLSEIRNDRIVDLPESALVSAAARTAEVEDPAAREGFDAIWQALGGLSGARVRMPTDFLSIRAESSYPLSDVLLALLPRREAAAEQTEAARLQLEAKKRDLELRIRELYWTHTRARWLAAVARHNRETVEGHLCEARVAHRLGASTSLDLLEVNRALSEARVHERRAEGAARIAERAIWTLTGENSAVAVERPRANFPAPNCDAASEHARSERPEVRALLAAERASLRGAEATRAEGYPHFTIVAGMELGYPNRYFLPPPDRFDMTWDISAMVSFSVDQMVRRTFEADALESVAHEHRAEREAFLDQVALEAGQACEELRAATESLEDAANAVSFASDALASRQTSQRLGRGRHSDLLEAERRLAQLEAQHSALRAEAEIALARYRHATGARFATAELETGSQFATAELETAGLPR